MRVVHALIAFLVIVVGCASTPNLDYYTVDMNPSGKAVSDLNLEVGHFATAEKLDRTQIVIQQTPTRIDYYSNERWAASVGEMVEHKLIAEFGPEAEGRRGMIVSGRITAFEQVDASSGPQARVRLEVAIREAGAKRYETPLLEKTYEASRAADSNNVDAVVQALSRAIEAIAAEIAEDAAGL
jgi:ABC-type uncharacterized transport system auxiliary subunit